MSPTSSPTSSQVEPLLQEIGDDGEPSDSYPLKRCQADCDSNDECAGDLICFERTGVIPTVPGCGGEDTYNNDYCIVKSVPNLLNRIGNGLGEDAFGFCEGDCDEDTDCQGNLICQQRDDLEPIVGCIGEGRSTTDYCRPPDATTTTQAPPPCTNDDNWVFINRRGYEKDCDWVGRRPSKRCIKVGTNDVDAYTACPEYCGC